MKENYGVTQKQQTFFNSINLYEHG